MDPTPPKRHGGHDNLVAAMEPSMASLPVRNTSSEHVDPARQVSAPGRRHGHDNLTVPFEPTSLNLLNNAAEAKEEKLHLDLFGFWLIGIEIAMIILFFVFCSYSTPGGDSSVVDFYQFMRDIAFMMLIGFGYLMTFLKRHRFSSIAYTFLIVVIVMQWYILVSGFYHWVLTRSTAGIVIQFPQLITSLFCSGSVLISFGVWIGKIGVEQLMFLAMFQVVVYSTNSYIVEGLLEVRDVGGSIVIHMFGAYYGLAAGKFVSPSDTRDRALYAGASYTSDTFSMIGTIFLWAYWPSFNAAIVPPARQYVAIFNTVLALSGSAFITFALSRMLRTTRHFTMEDIQNATLAGGVAMGASADILMSPGAAILIGCLAGALSVFGFAILGPIVQRKLRIYDTCGVHNLHGMPSLLGAFASAIVCSQYATSPQANLPHGGTQWGYQLACICITLLISIASGIVAGFLVMKIPIIPKPQGVQLFDDSEYFELPDVFEAGVAPQPMTEGVLLPEARRSSAKDIELSNLNARNSPGIEAGLVEL